MLNACMFSGFYINIYFGGSNNNWCRMLCYYG